jgi:ABC-2 type transport system ATP-binding protein
LFFDEPTLGMDPLAREFRQLVKDLRSEGRTILLTTHDMGEAEAVSDRVALIDRGRVLAVETPRTLSQWVAKYERIDFECGRPDVADSLRALPGVACVSLLVSGSYRVELSDESAARTVLSFLVGTGVTFVRTSRPSLEEVYVHIIGERSGLKPGMTPT